MTRGSWDPLGVIESYMNPKFDLYKGMEDFSCLLEGVGLLRLTEADTERVVKTIWKVEPRFASFNAGSVFCELRSKSSELCRSKITFTKWSKIVNSTDQEIKDHFRSQGLMRSKIERSLFEKITDQ